MGDHILCWIFSPQYTLETYTEERSTSWEHEPYHGKSWSRSSADGGSLHVLPSTGGSVDGPINGPPPGPWEIHCNPTQTFHNEVHFLEVPQTSSVTVSRVWTDDGRDLRSHVSSPASALPWMWCYGLDAMSHVHGAWFQKVHHVFGSGQDLEVRPAWTSAHGVVLALSRHRPKAVSAEGSNEALRVI